MNYRILIASLFFYGWWGHAHATGHSGRGMYPKIANATVVADNSYPFMAAIQYSDAESLENPYGHQCGGTLISKDKILTAAHCVSSKAKDGTLTIEPGELFKVSVGMRSYGTNQGFRRGVKEIKVHPRYASLKNPPFAYDLAILTLDEPVSDIKPVVLGTGAMDKPGTSGLIIGWGATSSDTIEKSEDMLESRLKVGKNNQCTIDVRRATQGAFRFKASIQLCAYTASGPCSGDSGGPLLHYADGRFFEIGIVSFGGKCGTGAVSVYTRTSNKEISNFIKSNK